MQRFATLAVPALCGNPSPTQPGGDRLLFGARSDIVISLSAVSVIFRANRAGGPSGVCAAVRSAFKLRLSGRFCDHEPPAVVVAGTCRPALLHCPVTLSNRATKAHASGGQLQ